MNLGMHIENQKTRKNEAGLDAAFARLETALRIDDVDFVSRALRGGVPIDAHTRRGDPLLTLASYSGASAVTALLIEAGADLEARNAKGHTALAGAAFTGNVAMIQLLLEAGADVDGQCSNGQTALDFANAFAQAEAAAALQGFLRP